MSLRQQQAAVFLGTIAVIFGLFSAGVWLVAQRLTTEATLQTALLLARQVEIALADSLRQRPVIVQSTQSRSQSSSFWNFLGNIFPGNSPTVTRQTTVQSPSRRTEVKGLMRAFVDRSGSIEAMWVFNADGKILYSSTGEQKDQMVDDAKLVASLRSGRTIINSTVRGKTTYYDVVVPLQMPEGVRSPGGLKLWINPADWTELLAGMWRQLTLLLALGGGVAVLSAFLTTALYTRRFRLISETLRQAEDGTYAARPTYASHDEVGTSLDLIDRLVLKQKKTNGAPVPAQRLALAARTLAHEVKTPLNALAIHLEVLRSIARQPEEPNGAGDQQQRSIAALETSIRHVDRLIRDFSDYSTPVGMERKSIDVAEVLGSSVEAIASSCAAKQIVLNTVLTPGPWKVSGDQTRLRQAFDNLLCNAIEAQPDGGEVCVTVNKSEDAITVDISDAGPGVPLERQSQLFEFGNTTKIGGNGIGLPLTQLIVEAHGGSLVHQNSDGNRSGATFRMTLPTERI